MKKLIDLLLLSLLFLISCRIEATPTPTAVSQLPPTETSTTDPTHTPEATPTLTDTAEPTATETAVPPTETATIVDTIEPTATETAMPSSTPTVTASPTTTLPPTAAPVVEVPGAIVPPGFSIIKYADIYRPTSLAFDPNGRLFATSFDGTVHVFTDFDGDGRADQDDIFASGFDTPLGVFARSQPRDVLVSSNGKVTVLRDLDGNNSAESRFDLITGLPTGLHQNNNLKVGPDGWIYMGVGSTCDVCDEPDERSATIMRFDPNSGAGEIVAEGLRNPYDFAFHPQTNAIFATDNGRDDLGVHHPFEELNHIIPGEHYGWPNCWGELNGTDCEGTQQAVGFFEARASANSIEFYTGSEFPPAYQWSAFVTLFGSFETRVQTGVLQIVIRPEGDGYTTQMNWFALWPDARPLGLTQGPDGAIYVGDYLQDVIYRISYGD